MAARIGTPLLALLLASVPAAADELVLPAAALDRTAAVVAVWHPSRPAPGTLTVTWTDGFGRIVERHVLALAEPLPEAAITLDLRRARALGNRVQAVFVPADGAPASRSQAMFVARPPPGWPRYEVLLWQDPPPGGLAALPALGITGTKLLHPLSLDAQAAAARRITANLRWFDENLATDFYAPYHRYRPGLPVTWAFDRLRARHAAAPEDDSVFERTPSLSDPAWLASVRARLSEVARLQAPYRPLYLNLGDETGIADLAAAWDFDRSDASLTAMRGWLRQRFGGLASLNQAWGTRFDRWDAVTPALTRDALRDDSAVPSWMAFKQWMDIAFADAVRAGADAVHAGDPSVLAGLEGAQVPGWGGYDYARLAPALDVMEIYDNGNAVEIARSFNPKLIVLTTSAAGGPGEVHRLWHEFLLGGRGSILWDDAGDVLRADGTAGPRGRELAPLFTAWHGALGAQFLDAQPVAGRVAILYSQASFRLGWLLARRADGTQWEARDAEAETADNPWRAAGRRAAALLADLGAAPRWAAPDALVAGALERDGVRALVLPHSIALSDAELAAVRRFAANGGMVLADITPGERDEAGRTRPAPPLADLAAAGRLLFPEVLRQTNPAPAPMAALLQAAGAQPPLAVLEPDGRPAAGLDIRLWRSGAALLVAIQRQDGRAAARELTLHLPAPAWAQAFGDPSAVEIQQLRLLLDPVTPTLLVLSETRLPGPSVSGPGQAAAGEMVPIRIGLDGPTPLAAHFVTIQVSDPSGVVAPALADTLRVPGGGTVWQWPLAVDDRPGRWRVQVTDAPTGRVAGLDVVVR